MSGKVLADTGGAYLDNPTEIATDAFYFAFLIMKVSQTGEENYFVLGMEAHVIQDGETNRFLNNVFGPNDSRAYIFKCTGIDKYCSLQLVGVLYNKCLNKSSFD